MGPRKLGRKKEVTWENKNKFKGKRDKIYIEDGERKLQGGNGGMGKRELVVKIKLKKELQFGSKSGVIEEIENKQRRQKKIKAKSDKEEIKRNWSKWMKK